MFEKVRSELLELTRRELKASVTKDVLIIQASLTLDELEKSIQALTSRFREWYEYYNPELSKKVHDEEVFVNKTLQADKVEESVGGKLLQHDIKILQEIAKKLKSLHESSKSIEEYINSSMQECCPNLAELAGAKLGAKILTVAHGLSNLAKMSSSKLQLLGAEKALFRHLLGLGKSPKHGIIMNHPFILNAPKDKKGKASRLFADKLSIAAKLDYFKGDFLAPKLKKEIEEKLK